MVSRTYVLPFLAAVLAFTFAFTPMPGSAAPTPCTVPTTACARWITFGGGPARSMVYATYPLGVPQPAVTRALIMVHGALRNADHYFETATAAGFFSMALATP